MIFSDCYDPYFILNFLRANYGCYINILHEYYSTTHGSRVEKVKSERNLNAVIANTISCIVKNGVGERRMNEF